MRINGSYGHDLVPLRGGNLDKNELPKASDAPASAADDPNAILSYDKYVQKAKQTGEVDLTAVRNAQKLIEDGQLDTPEGAKRAAENLFSRGI